jgi:hypothetical protein
VILSRLRYILLLLILALPGCGGSHFVATPVPTPAPTPAPVPPPAPVSGDPWFGTAGNVLISETNDGDGILDFIWIGFNSQTEWQKFLINQKTPPFFRIGGVVVPTTQNSVHFYFDPNTTTSDNGGILEEQTLLDFLKAHPDAKSGLGIWLIFGKVEQIK